MFSVDILYHVLNAVLRDQCVQCKGLNKSQETKNYFEMSKFVSKLLRVDALLPLLPDKFVYTI